MVDMKRDGKGKFKLRKNLPRYFCSEVFTSMLSCDMPDLDISLTFKDRTNASELDCVALIEQLGEMLRVMKGLKNVLAITSAKVPIVKLVQQQWGVEADISLYNVLGRSSSNFSNIVVDDIVVRSTGEHKAAGSLLRTGPPLQDTRLHGQTVRKELRYWGREPRKPLQLRLYSHDDLLSPGQLHPFAAQLLSVKSDGTMNYIEKHICKL